MLNRSALLWPRRRQRRGGLRRSFHRWCCAVRRWHDRRMSHLTSLRLRQCGDRMGRHGRQALNVLRYWQRGNSAAKHVRLHGGARGGNRCTHRHDGLLSRRQMGLVGHGRLKSAPAGHGSGRSLNHDVGHVAHVRDVVIRDAVVVDDRVMAIDIHIAVNAHADVHHGRCTHDDCRRGSRRSGNDDAGTRARRRRDEDARRAHGRWPDDDIRSHVGPGDRSVIGRRHEFDVRPRPVARQKDDAVLPVLVVRLDPDVLGTRRHHPTACTPHPVALPGPIATGPHRIRLRRRRKVLDKHGGGCPPDRDGLRLLQRRIDKDADDRAKVVEPASLVALDPNVTRVLSMGGHRESREQRGNAQRNGCPRRTLGEVVLVILHVMSPSNQCRIVE